MKSLAERFWEKVDKTPGFGPQGTCWKWIGSRTPQGYGKISVNGKPIFAHRVIWLVETGKYPKQHSLHQCDNPACVRLSHLRDGSHRENMIEAVERGLRVYSPKTHCIRGHALIGDNIYVWRGKRACLVCRKLVQPQKHLLQKIIRRIRRA